MQIPLIKILRAVNVCLERLIVELSINPALIKVPIKYPIPLAVNIIPKSSSFFCNNNDKVGKEAPRVAEDAPYT